MKDGRYLQLKQSMRKGIKTGITAVTDVTQDLLRKEDKDK